MNLLLLALSLVLLGTKVLALVDCIVRKPYDFVAAGTLQKNGWLLILGLAVLTHLISIGPLGLLNLAGTVAAFVYLAQLRGSR